MEAHIVIRPSNIEVHVEPGGPGNRCSVSGNIKSGDQRTQAIGAAVNFALDREAHTIHFRVENYDD